MEAEPLHRSQDGCVIFGVKVTVVGELMIAGRILKHPLASVIVTE